MPVKPEIIAFVVAACWAGAAAGSEACPDLLASAASVRLAGVDAAGDPVLADGRSLRLVGLAPRQDAAEVARFAAGIARWRDIELRLVPAGEPDRWGRLPARLVSVPESARGEFGDLATMLIAAGAASRLPEAAHAGCGVPEPPAAQAKRSAPRTSPAATAPLPAGMLDGHDVAALRAHMGRLVAVEGRVASVGERAQRTYLNFSRRRGEAGAIMLPRRIWREMQGAGWTASGLSGKRVRARGILSGQDGLLLDVTSALALELID
jgi:hypothetical protein